MTGRKQRSAEHTVRRPRLTAILSAAFHRLLHELLRRNQPDSERKVVRIHEQQVALRIEGVAAPVCAADSSWICHSVLQSGWSENSMAPHPRQPFATGLPIFRRETPGVIR